MAPKRQGVVVRCCVCDKILYKQQCQIKRSKRHFCSNKCVGIANKGNKYNPGKRTGKMMTCSICGKTKYKSQWELKNNAKYCSYKCLAASKKKGVYIPCSVCGKLSYVHGYRLNITKKFFCTEHVNVPLGEMKQCCICGKLSYKKLSQIKKNSSGNFYCSLNCQNNSSEFQAYARTRAQILPNKPEQKLIDFFKEQNLPYRYTGDGSFSIGNKVPDFVNINGEKKAVDLFGDYWHNPDVRANLGKSPESEEDRIAKFKEYGWDLVVIWEHTLKDKNWKKLVMEKL
jgi:G:T-mismatch repair DNA endonuclease (very short patch repair protein)